MVGAGFAFAVVLMALAAVGRVSVDRATNPVLIALERQRFDLALYGLALLVATAFGYFVASGLG